MTVISLPPTLDRFAENAVASGRYHDVPAVIRAALALLQSADADHTALIRSLEEADAKGDGDGFHDMDDVEQEMDAIIDAAERGRG